MSRPVAAVALVSATAAAAVGLTGCAGGGPAMKLVTPRTLDGGTYVLDKDTQALAREGTSVQDGMPEGATSVLARYRRADDSTGKSRLAFSGTYGTIGEPRKVQDDMFRSFVSGSSATVVAERRVFHPDGADGPAIECEVVRMAKQPRLHAPVCTWAQSSDAALVVDVNPKNAAPSSVDVAAFAKVTAGIYQDTRKPA